jgi:sugar transferase (PEP-CTERM/EpsH1 system associated)
MVPLIRTDPAEELARFDESSRAFMPAQIENENSISASSPGQAEARTHGERLRVLHVVARLGLGGTEHGVLKVLNGLGEKQFEHRLCAVRGVDADFASRMNVAGKAYSAGSAKPGLQFPLFRLMRIMKEYRPHVVHTRNFGALEAIFAARLARVPVAIHSEHGYELEILGGLPLRRRILCRVLFPMADAVFAVTNELRTYHSGQSWLTPEKFRVIYNGVNTDRFAPLNSDAAPLRKDLGLPTDRFLIGSVGRLVPIKDHSTLLQAATQLLRQGNNLHVLLVGDGPERATLQQYVASTPELSGRVTFLGSSDRVPELMKAMDVFVLPSISEGMSNTILEAMATGLPVVVTHAGGNPEMIDHEFSGLLFAPRDVRTLASHLVRLIESADLRRHLGEAARRRAMERFSLAEMMRRYRDLYFELAGKRGKQEGI